MRTQGHGESQNKEVTIPSPQRPKRETKPTTIAEAISRLAAATKNLCGEVELFRGLLKDFGQIPKRPIQWRTGLEWYQDPKTREPRSKLFQIEGAIQAATSPTAQMTLIKALAQDLDGAFRDIRAARTDIEAIVGTPTARDRFRDWHKKRR